MTADQPATAAPAPRPDPGWPSGRRHEQAAALIRSQIKDGTLAPGSPAPIIAALAKATGYSALTCRKAIALLARDGTLTPGAGPQSRYRVRDPANPARDPAPAARLAAELAGQLAARRRYAGRTQRQLAAMTGYSEATVSHAESGELQHKRDFWHAADTALTANGALLATYDAWLAARPAPTATPIVTINWPNGTTTTHAQPPDPSTADL